VCSLCSHALLVQYRHDPDDTEAEETTVLDDVQLLCGSNKAPGHHFHWTCLQEYDEEGWDRKRCPLPSCGGNPVKDGLLLVIVRNEGGVTEDFNIGKVFDEEKWESEQPISWKKSRALLSALQSGEHDEAEKLLREEGVTPDAFYEEGHLTALHMAAMSDDEKAAKLLLRYGVNVYEPTATGETALQLAQQNGAGAVAAILKAHSSSKS